MLISAGHISFIAPPALPAALHFQPACRPEHITPAAGEQSVNPSQRGSIKSLALTREPARRATVRHFAGRPLGGAACSGIEPQHQASRLVRFSHVVNVSPLTQAGCPRSSQQADV